jgi:heterodisulfide reductase subunit D
MVERILYWRGCMSRLRVKSIADSTEKLLSKMGVKYETLGESEGCCGSVLKRTGQTEAALTIAKETTRKIKAKGYQEVVTSCPGCYRTMANEYKAYFGEAPFHVEHISRFLYKRAKLLKGHLKPMKMKVAYHDPCHLGRHMGVYEEPRELLKMVPGVELVEFKQSREKSVCCGSGGGVRSTLPELSLEVSRTVLAEMPPADLLVTSCPFCNYNLREGGRGTKLRVMDLPEFILKAWRD